MNKPEFFLEIFLQPGELYFGDRETRIRTVLGSCVAITLWHPSLYIGGMCHFMLPGSRRRQRATQFDGRYADEALLMFMQELRKSNTSPKDYEVKMFGGGDQFPGQSKPDRISVPDSNVIAGRELLAHHGFKLKAEHLGGTGHRNVIFDLWSGHVWMRHVSKGLERIQA
ncbi:MULTISPECIES: chemotaxis protein CheD [Methylomonas]|uniref:Probable chemoreceptor glutamine deamidase CheD n=1 Tax=Methylomonas koyamae TaxID=702114 RepID=A0AA91I4R7_9GAMM|nr:MULTISPECIES: chemotaxis protein CheD [Methylomonas]ANE57281.1 chemotaxis protein CheD [Methylomonas sp. DH-1]OAI24999.1 chemotaxis protein CheD [Methylomonas koyamae]